MVEEDEGVIVLSLDSLRFSSGLLADHVGSARPCSDEMTRMECRWGWIREERGGW